MIYFKLPSPKQLVTEDRQKYNLTYYTIVSFSPAAWQICRGQYLNWYSSGCPGFTEKLAGFDVKRVSWLVYFKFKLKKLLGMKTV